MASPADSSVRFGILLSGYAGAYRRLADAIPERDEAAVFHALFETLNWAVTIDQAAGEQWLPAGKPLKQGWREKIHGAQAMAGVRFARNRVHHQWAAAVEIDTSGRRYPLRYPRRYFEVIWKPSAELPAGNDEGRERYDALLAGEPVDVTLHILGEVFDDVWEFLEIPGKFGLPPSGFRERLMRE